MRGFATPLIDDPLFTRGDKRIDLVIAEVKRGPCELNPSWTEASRRVIHYALDAVGLIDEDEVDAAAAGLYAKCDYDNGEQRLRIVAFGSNRDAAFNATQLVWPEVFGFIYRRFWEHRYSKSDHDQWGPIGGDLFNHVGNFHNDEAAFVADALKRL